MGREVEHVLLTKNVWQSLSLDRAAGRRKEANSTTFHHRRTNSLISRARS